MKKSLGILDELGIIEYIRDHKIDIEYVRKHKIDIEYKKPKLVILEDEHPLVAWYSYSENEIGFSKKSMKKWIDNQLKYLSYKEENEREIDNLLKSLDYKKIISDRKDIVEYLNGKKAHIEKYTRFLEGKIWLFKKYIKAVNKLLKSLGYEDIKDIKYLDMALLYNSVLLCPFYVNERNIIEALTEAIILLTMLHEIWHSIDEYIFDNAKKALIKDPKNIYHILAYTHNRELRAAAFEVIMYYYLLTNLYNDERVYTAAYVNIPICRKYIEKINIMEKSSIDTERHMHYDLGLCYGNIIVAKYKSSLEENIHKIIDDLIGLDKERAIEMIKLYGDNLEWLSQNKNSNVII